MATGKKLTEAELKAQEEADNEYLRQELEKQKAEEKPKGKSVKDAIYEAAKANLEEVTRRFMTGGCTAAELEAAKAAVD